MLLDGVCFAGQAAAQCLFYSTCMQLTAAAWLFLLRRGLIVLLLLFLCCQPLLLPTTGALVLTC